MNIKSLSIAEVTDDNISALTNGFSQPAVFTGCADVIIDRQRLAPDRLAAEFGDSKLTIIKPKEEGKNEIGVLAYRQRAVERITVREFLADKVIVNQLYNARYYSDSIIYRDGHFVQDAKDFPKDSNFLSTIARDIRVPKYMQVRAKDIKVNIWMSLGLSKTALHYDAYDNFFLQLYGTKRWYLADCGQPLNWFYMSRRFPPTAKASLYSAVQNPFEYDRTRYPNFGRIKYVDVTLQPGDMMFVPYGWWHYVESPEDRFNLSLSFRRVTMARWTCQLTYDQILRGAIQRVFSPIVKTQR
jgi:hypothetical protein